MVETDFKADEAPQGLPIFVYGTLRDPDILRLALGPLRDRIAPVEARMEGVETFASGGGAYPALRAREGGSAPGLLLEPASAEVRAALDFFEDAFDYALVAQEVRVGEEIRSALVYQPGQTVEDDGTPWHLDHWVQTHKPLFLEAAREIMTYRLSGVARAGILRRAAQRLAAAAPTPMAALRTDFGEGAIVDHEVTREVTGFFALETHEFRHRTFDGGMSAPVRREVFVTGDAVSVLPWDPVTDKVLLIEQIRAGLLGRGEANPWNLEVIAGLIDGAESPEDTARREAQEEAGLTLGRMVQVGAFFPTPGAVTEHLTAFLAEADLSAVEGGLHGLASEHEDIRTLVVPRAEAMDALTTGEARNAPLVISLMALQARHGEMLAAWVGGVAAPPASG